METYEIDAIKIEKQKAMRRYRTFRKIATIVRTLEIFIAILIVSWSISSISAYIPSAIEISGKILRRLFSLLFSPHFVFVLGNAIVITLFAKSGDRKHVAVAGDDIIAEVEERESETVVIPAVEVEERETETVVVPAVEEERESEEKSYQRTQSSLEMVIVEEREKKQKVLRRSETEPRRKIGSGESTVRKYGEVDELSSDEFRRKVEAFIEKQQRLLREECKSVVVLSNKKNYRCNSL